MCIRDRGRGAWICDTDQGLKLLREYKGTVRRLEFEEQVLAYIKDQGFLYVDQYVRNREGELVSVADDGTRFILKDWFDKRECSIKDPAEAVAAVRQIAVLHRILRQIEMREAVSYTHLDVYKRQAENQAGASGGAFGVRKGARLENFQTNFRADFRTNFWTKKLVVPGLFVLQ